MSLAYRNKTIRGALTVKSMATGATVLKTMKKEGERLKHGKLDAGVSPRRTTWDCIYQSPSSVLWLKSISMFTIYQICTMHLYSVMFPRSKGGPLRERQAEAAGNKDHFIKIYTYI